MPIRYISHIAHDISHDNEVLLPADSSSIYDKRQFELTVVRVNQPFLLGLVIEEAAYNTYLRGHNLDRQFLR